MAWQLEYPSARMNWVVLFASAAAVADAQGSMGKMLGSADATRHVPLIIGSEWSIAGQTEQAYLSKVFKAAAGSGVVLGILFSLLMFLSNVILCKYL